MVRSEGRKSREGREVEGRGFTLLVLCTPGPEIPTSRLEAGIVETSLLHGLRGLRAWSRLRPFCSGGPSCRHLIVNCSRRGLSRSVLLFARGNLQYLVAVA